jgi:hypothetical protein
MPQFDTFSFFSQLFWVFFGFITLYLLFCFYLLPALATILKVRKRKLNQISSSSDSAGLVVDSQNKITINDNVMLLITEWNAGVASKLESHTNSDFASLNLTLSAFIVKFEVLREYNFSLLSQSQLTTLFYN